MMIFFNRNLTGKGFPPPPSNSLPPAQKSKISSASFPAQKPKISSASFPNSNVKIASASNRGDILKCVCVFVCANKSKLVTQFFDGRRTVTVGSQWLMTSYHNIVEIPVDPCRSASLKCAEWFIMQYTKECDFCSSTVTVHEPLCMDVRFFTNNPARVFSWR